MLKNLDGKICVIVGGSKGIGYALAKHLHGLGATILISGRNKREVKKSAISISDDLSFINSFEMDILNLVSIQRNFKKILKKYKKIDILICSAGIFEPIGMFSQVPFSKHQKTIQTNLIGIMKCCYETIPSMQRNGGGKIILFSGGGIGGDIPLEHASSYFISKGSLALLAEVLAAELYQDNIQINAILPGKILTNLTKATFKLPENQLGKVLTKANLEFKKTGGQSIKPILELVTFLCTNDLKHLSGKILSAQWDDLTNFKDSPDWRYKLRRIDDNLYTKSK